MIINQIVQSNPPPQKKKKDSQGCLSDILGKKIFFGSTCTIK